MDAWPTHHQAACVYLLPSSGSDFLLLSIVKGRQLKTDLENEKIVHQSNS